MHLTALKLAFRVEEAGIRPNLYSPRLAWKCIELSQAGFEFETNYFQMRQPASQTCSWAL